MISKSLSCGLNARANVMGRHAVLWMACLMIFAFAAISPREALANPKFAAVTVDARNGKLLVSENADSIRHPASLTKMMTLYLVFQDLKAGKIKLDTPIRMSARAAGMAPSKLGVRPGKTITVETAIKALVVKSANDVAAALAENLGGTESDFAKRMTRTARSMGMTKTTFLNASGLPNPGQVTTARDMATLGLRLMRDYPQYYPYFRTQSFTYGGQTINGHNRLLGRFDGTDGIKTGYINASGFNLVSSVRRGDKRLVGVVLGGKTGASRNAYMMKMLESQFRNARGGKTIAALAGSSKGVIDPVESETQVAEAPTKRTKRAVFGKNSGESVAPETKAKTIAELAVTEEGDTGSEAPESIAEAAPPKAAAPSDIPKLLESNVGGVTVPSNTPFQVKTQPDTGGVDPQTLAAVAPPEQWSIQVGAYSSKTDAQARLQELRRKSPDLFDGKTALTIAVEKDKVVTYRARFSGYSEPQAKAACKALERQKAGCYVLAPAS